MNRVRGLDSIRVLLALWVAMNHVMKPPLTAGLDTSTGVGWILDRAYALSFNGQAAVIGFFLISGSCVHLPYRETGPTSLLAYYLRRHIRVGAPFALVLVLTYFLPKREADLERGIFWSVYAELIYYTLYPLIFRLRRATSWNALIVGSCLFIPLVIFADHPDGNYHDAGAALAWILGLPCWLLGCKLAEEFDKPGRAVGRAEIWFWRLSVWATSVLCYYLRFHTPIKHYYSLDIFAVLVYFWLEREIRYFMTVTPPRFMESAGGWSYSLYLTHFFGATAFAALALPRFGFFADWIIKCAFVLGTAYCFYLAVERPSHRLARRLARRFSADDETAKTRPDVASERSPMEVGSSVPPLLTAVSSEQP
jgi:peptidoglycan/LPS O-acetylase OafA/YrhL